MSAASGNYQIQTVFNDSGTKIAGANFPVNVPGDTTQPLVHPYVLIGVGVGFLAGLFISPFLRRFERSVEKPSLR